MMRCGESGLSDLHKCFTDYLDRRIEEEESEPEFIRIRTPDGSEHEIPSGKAEFLTMLRAARAAWK